MPKRRSEFISCSEFISVRRVGPLLPLMILRAVPRLAKVLTLRMRRPVLDLSEHRRNGVYVDWD